MLDALDFLFTNTVIETDDYLSECFTPLELIVLTLGVTWMLQQLSMLWRQCGINNAVKTLEKLPYIGPKVKAEVNKEISKLLWPLKADIDERRNEYHIYPTLPETGLSSESILERFNHLQDHYQPGRLSGAVYTSNDEETSTLLQTVWTKTNLTNPMHSEWPLINLMEAEIISMMQHLLRGDAGAPGIITHGGSTSILEACKAYVLAARENGIDHPEIIAPDSAHVAFDKAARILNAKLVKVPVDVKTGGADVNAMYHAINKNTCLLVGSAPSFPMGVIDPIKALGQLAIKYHLPLHVDSCLGGFLTVFAKEAGFTDIPSCDFSVAGVTSISIDTHKYGQTPKGTSVLVFRKKAAASPTHTHLDWTGGMYVTPSIDGSRSGADIAVLWSTLCFKGKEKYCADTFLILNLQRKLIEEAKKISGIIIPYQSLLSVIPIQTEKGINAMVVAEQFQKRGWSVNLLQTANQQPNGFHFCVTIVHARQEDFVDLFMADLRAAVMFAKENPAAKPTGIAKAYGSLGFVPPYVQSQVGLMYTRINYTLPNIPIEGLNQPENSRLAMKLHQE